ncbi:MAG TPA: hydroxysqualene dehydroxylase HpnE [Phycisphaerales bacterium]|nr:hydroxysqualene dehydroxylase HpnE [Phycisphaerales bacterium]
MTDRHVIIVGGGIAGIAAALRLSEHGIRVTLLETRKKLGGRATSFTDVRTGHVIDNCQHVALGCCTNFLDLCARLGVRDKIDWRREIFWVEEGGRTSLLIPGILPAPAHFTASFLRASFLTMAEKLAIGRAMRAVMAEDPGEERARTFQDWLLGHGQSPAVIDKFWSPVIVSACNLSVDRVAASSALHVFREGFLAHRDAAMVGVPSVPLVEMYDGAEECIKRGGGDVRLGCGVEEIRPDRVRTTACEEIVADRVICAVPFERAVRIVAEDVRRMDGRFGDMALLRHSPILGVHLVFESPVLPMHSAVLVSRPTQWLFRKDDAGVMVHAVISAADEWIELTEAEITERVLADIHACFPKSRGVKLVSSRPVKEKLATFAPTPGSDDARPATEGPSGLILAGDYVQTGWPATMEGATRSGYMAAAAVLGESRERFLQPSLKTGMFARMMGLE